MEHHLMHRDFNELLNNKIMKLQNFTQEDKPVGRNKF